jgi:hypothetical protein
MDEPRGNSRLHIAWKMAIVAAFNCAAAVGLAADADRKVDGGGLRALLAQGWRADSDWAPSLPGPQIVRPAANLINAIPSSLLVESASGSVRSCGTRAAPTLVDLISQRSPLPQAKIVRPVATPLLVPLPAPVPPLRVAEPIELESIGWGDQGMPQPVTLEVVPQVSAVESPSQSLYEFEGMLLGEGLAVDPH